MSASVSPAYERAHDPLCCAHGRPTSWEPEMCVCDIIAQVREETVRTCAGAAYADLLALEDDMVEAFGKGDAARIVAGYRSAMPSFQPIERALLEGEK